MTLKWDGDAVAKKLKLAAIQGSIVTMEQIIAQSVKNCPVDTGTLRNAHTVTVNKDINAQEGYARAQTGQLEHDSEATLEVTKVYGSVNTPYAHRQHEDVNLQHSEGGAKFLEKAWNDKIKNHAENVKRETRKAGLI